MTAAELVTTCKLPVQLADHGMVRQVVEARINPISKRVMVRYDDGGEDDLGAGVQINLTPSPSP